MLTKKEVMKGAEYKLQMIQQIKSFVIDYTLAKHESTREQFSFEFNNLYGLNMIGIKNTLLATCSLKLISSAIGVNTLLEDVLAIRNTRMHTQS